LHEWREGWANHLNRALEQAKGKERVDHRSYEAREIDRQPTNHLGPQATQRERRGKRSCIGDENRQAHDRNRKQATRQRAAKNIAAAIARQETQASTRERPPASNENRDAITQLNDRYGVRMAKTEEESRELYDKRPASLKRELEEIRTRFDEGGMFYHLTRAKADRQRAQKLQLSIQDDETRAQSGGAVCFASH
jgi:hypothetical protein